MKQVFFIFIKKHWLKLLLVVLICNPFSLTLLIIVFGFIQIALIDGLSYNFSSYIGREVKVAPFAGIDKTLQDSFYISTRAEAQNSHRGEGEISPPLGEYTSFQVHEVKLRSGGLFNIHQVCILGNSKSLKLLILEDCVELAKVDAVTKFFLEAEIEIKKFGSAYVSLNVPINGEFSYESMKPILNEGKVLTYKVSSRTELVELITPKDLAFDHYYWIMEESKPMLVKNRAKFD